MFDPRTGDAAEVVRVGDQVVQHALHALQLDLPDLEGKLSDLGVDCQI